MENSRKKKILLVTRPICPPWDEASKNFAYFLAKNVQGFEFTLLTCGKKIEGLPDNVQQEPIYTSAKLSWWQRMKLLKLIPLRNNFDAMHFMLTPTKLNVWAFKTFIKSKKVKNIQTIATLREDLYSDEEIRKLMFGDLIITYSDYAKNKLNELGFQNVKRIYPGIDLEKNYPAGKKPEILKQFGFTSADFIINFTGEYTRLGAIDGVIKTFIEVSKQIPSAKLSLAVRLKNKADEEKKEEVVEKLKQHNLLERVSFHDDQSYEMPDIFNLCDISIFPVQNMKGKFDVPLAVVEAMASEKPVIISDLPILQEFANAENSVKIKTGDWKELENAIVDLYENPEKRRNIGQAARAYVENNFDIKNVAKEYEKIYEQI